MTLLGLALALVIDAGENSVCRTITCMRAEYAVGDKVCFTTTNSFAIHIGAGNGAFAQFYFIVRNIVTAPEYTVVQAADYKVIGLFEEGALFPLTKDPVSRSNGCAIVE
ncbi:hypothetical protein [Methylopila sp. Yamaguchi]|uniref:hypothetical protein n=1 Tax=Methylopila sp. Yamaguchi TaxID=1437817 RepID=UPI0011AF6C1F|nr:hypothetical protein [Methylopila sp. Yamaguchi]